MHLDYSPPHPPIQSSIRFATSVEADFRAASVGAGAESEI
jgi:hypothetical protein